MLKLKTMLIFGVAFWFTSAILFAGMIFLCPGFPYFPKIVYRSTTNNSSVWLGKGQYYILFFIEGEQKLAVSRGDVGEVKVDAVRSDGKKEAVLVDPSDFYFDDAPDGSGLRGHSVGSFAIPVEEQITIESNFRKYGYQGLLIKTGFKTMIISMAIFGMSALLLTCFVLRFIRASKTAGTHN